MANSALKNKYFNVPDKVVDVVKGNLDKYGSDSDKGANRARKIITKKRLTYSEMKNIKSYFDNYEGDGMDAEFKLNGGDTLKDWVDSELEQARDVVDSEKRVRMDAGEENQFKKTHTKDKDNANPTGVGMVKIHKGANMRNIMNNTTVYESKSINEEIEEIKRIIRYLI
jgi:hypothetical protein